MNSEYMIRALFASVVLTAVSSTILLLLDGGDDINKISYTFVAWASAFIGTLVGATKD